MRLNLQKESLPNLGEDILSSPSKNTRMVPSISATVENDPSAQGDKSSVLLTRKLNGGNFSS